MRKGQITIFVIVGIVALLIIAFFTIDQTLPSLPIQEDPESARVQACLETSLATSIDEVGSVGTSDEQVIVAGMPVPVYNYGLQKDTPDAAAIQSELKRRWSTEAMVCAGLTDSPNLEIILGEEEVSGVVEIPMQSQGRSMMKRFSVQSPARIPTYLRILDRIFLDKDIPADIILDLIKSEKVGIDVIFDQEVFTYLISDKTKTGKELVWIAAKVRDQYPTKTSLSESDGDNR